VLTNRWSYLGLACSIALVLALLGAGEIAAQTQPSRSAEKAPASTAGVSPTHDENLVATREQLLKLLRISPKLTTVIVRDPSLLANQEYVSRNNPELAQFLQGHPEIVRNPEFYLFSNLGGRGKFNPAISLEQEVWPNPNTREPEFSDLPKMLGVFLFFICILASLIWLLRVLLESRRWSRMLKLQTEVHSRLLDKFATNEDLLAYMNSEAGKRYLELAPVAAGQSDREGGHPDAGRCRTGVGRNGILLPAEQHPGNQCHSDAADFGDDRVHAGAWIHHCRGSLLGAGLAFWPATPSRIGKSSR
jgi:hypothetical protein